MFQTPPHQSAAQKASLQQNGTHTLFYWGQRGEALITLEQSGPRSRAQWALTEAGAKRRFDPLKAPKGGIFRVVDRKF